VDKRPRQSFPRHYRILKGSDYRVIYTEGKKLSGERFVLYARDNDLGYPRLGITVSRKVGNAVVRNRIKRLFREIFRKSRAGIPHHCDWVVNARRGCAGASYGQLAAEFLALAGRIVPMSGE